MGTHSQTYNAPPSGNSLYVPELSGRKIVSVKREGMGYNIIQVDRGTPGNGQVNVMMGNFTFANDFTYYVDPAATSDLDIITERVFIIWET